MDDMRVEEMTAAHYLAFKEKLVPMEAGERPGPRPSTLVFQFQLEAQ